MRSGVFVAVVLFGLTSAGPITTAEEGTKVTSVATLVKEIKSSSSSERFTLAYKLSDMLRHMDRSELDAINRNIIDEIALMLSVENEGVVFAAASALRYIGQPASHTVPALLTALKEVEASHSRGPVRPGGMGADDAIVNTLIELKACMPPSKPVVSNSCDYLLR